MIFLEFCWKFDNNMQPFLDFGQSNLNSEPSFVGINEALREIWLFEREFRTTGCPKKSFSI